MMRHALTDVNDKSCRNAMPWGYSSGLKFDIMVTSTQAINVFKSVPCFF